MDIETQVSQCDQLVELQQRLGVKLNDLEILQKALIHRSYLGETTGFESNERLEFLGDSVVGLVVAEHLYHQMQDWPEGELSKAKAVAVSEPVLAEAARSLDLQSVLLMSVGEHQSGGRERASILSDTYEAIVAVVYLDQGLEVAQDFILRSLAPILDEISAGSHLRDHKSRLQQIAQSRTKVAPRYTVVRETGADHDKTFTVHVEVDGKTLGKGTGKSKKQAEQAAAEVALQDLLPQGSIQELDDVDAAE
ncbi:MAG: ribonuclease III [Armatimonadota bacterium]